VWTLLLADKVWRQSHVNADRKLRITGFSYFVHRPVILKTRKHNVRETGSVSVLRWWGRHLLWLGPLERANPTE
jgi:hypothetical protein